MASVGVESMGEDLMRFDPAGDATQAVGAGVFLVSYSLPPEEKNWRRNRTAYVVASSGQRAIELILEDTPDATIWNVTHKGYTAFIFIDPELLH